MSRFIITDDMIENEDYVICQICGKKFRYLTTHIKSTHKISIEDYKRQFPNSLIKSKNFSSDRAKAIEDGCMKKYGVKNVGQLDFVKEGNKKYFNDKYGCNSYMKTKEFQKKSKNTIINKYGVDNVMKDDDIKNKCLASYNKTMNEKYGVSFGLQSENLWLKAMKENSSVKQNKPEKIIDSLSEKIIYTGDHKFWITFKDGTHKNPDFLVEPFKETKKVIEYAGNYWHTEQEMAEVVRKYNELGIECLLIWEKDFKENKSKVIENILNFLK